MTETPLDPSLWSDVQTQLRPRARLDEEPAQAQPTDAELSLVYGVDQSLPFSTPWLNNTWELFQNAEEQTPTIRQLIAMRRVDGQARALYRLLTLPIRGTLDSSVIQPDDGDTGEAEFIDNMFNLPACAGGMNITFPKFMAQLLRALFDGFAPFEQVYWCPDKGPLKGKYTLQKLSYRPPETITFLTDKNGNFQGFRQQTVYMGAVVDVQIPLENAFYYSAQEEENPFYGVSFFQSAFSHYDKKTKLTYILHLAAQRHAVGMRAGEYPAAATNKDKMDFANQLKNFGLAQWMMYGSGYKVSNLTETGTFDFLSIINFHNSQMSKSVLASFFDKEQGAGQGDAKLVDFSTESDAMFVQMLEAIMGEIESAINTYIIPKFIDWNFGTGKYPKFKFGAFTDEKRSEINAIFASLAIAGQGVNVTQEFMMALEKYMNNELDLGLDYEKIEKEQAAQEAQQAQEAQAASSYPQGQEGAQGAPGAALGQELASGTDQPPATAQGSPAAPADEDNVPFSMPLVETSYVVTSSIDLEMVKLARELLLELRHE